MNNRKMWCSCCVFMAKKFFSCFLFHIRRLSKRLSFISENKFAENEQKKRHKLNHCVQFFFSFLLDMSVMTCLIKRHFIENIVRTCKNVFFFAFSIFNFNGIL